MILDNDLTPEARRHLHIFTKCLPVRVKLHEVLRLLDDTSDRVCLDIGTENGMVSYHLRKRGGEWYTLATNDAIRDAVHAVVERNVLKFVGGTLPFENKTFDAVVVLDFLERVESDELFIAECHRVLKPDGCLITNVAHIKRWTLLRPLRALLGLAHEREGRVRPGYTESQLFSVLKHGFDVYHMRSYSRFFVELTDAVVRALVARVTTGDRQDVDGVRRIYSVAHAFYWLAFQLDMLIFFTRGHYLIATAKRRAWRPRKAPVLVDGRSISEAVLSKAVK